MGDTRVKEQIQYLGLLENLRVRRAGFCYRNTYEKWIKRYYMLTPKTFPDWHRHFNDDKAAVTYLLEHIGLGAEEYRLGNTKVFIREPKSLFRVEKSRMDGLNRLATIMQATWKMYKMRKAFLAMKDQSSDLFAGKKRATSPQHCVGAGGLLWRYVVIQGKSRYGLVKIAIWRS